MRRKNILQLLILAGFILWNSCASTGTPSGGPKDVTPPRLLKSIPLKNQLNYNKRCVELFFDELVSLESPSEKIIISPPQKIEPTIKAIGNKITVLFSDTLHPATTYTIDFTDAIVDYNEKNKFGDYAFSFSTGNKIDSLCISGTVLDAYNLNPISGVIIGVQTNLNDSSFRKIPFEHISKTDQKGFFAIKGLPESKFHLYALGDKNKDYRFDQPGESIAYYDSIIRPWTEPCVKNDTIWKDSITIDTVNVRNITCYKPDNIILRYFSEDFGRQYLAKRARLSRNMLSLTFGYKSEQLPSIKLLNSKASDWYLLEANQTKDTLVYWITDTIVSSMDTIRLQLDYMKTDSLNKLSPAIDTLNLISRTFHPKAGVSENKKKKDKDKDILNVPSVFHLMLKTDLQTTMDIFSVPRFQWETPIKEVRGNPWNLYKKKDSIWVKTPFTFQKDSVYLRDYILKSKWEFGAEYRFDIDSGMVVGLYGKTNNKYSQTFKVRAEEEYSRLNILISGISGSGFVEVLDKSDKVVRRKMIENNKAEFLYLMPGSYYVRAIEDRNANFRWDTGNYANRQQPENVYYNPRKLNLRANWDVDESWDINEYPVLQQKPKDLIPREGKK
jgi:hypothetical protein